MRHTIAIALNLEFKFESESEFGDSGTKAKFSPPPPLQFDLPICGSRKQTEGEGRAMGRDMQMMPEYE